eukprot:scaffold56734_cov41-Cyclotella_meneghiniana.AAC.4
MSHQGNKRQNHAGNSSGLSDLETFPPDASQWTQMRQEIMESLRAELQNGLQSRVDQLENENSQLKSKVASLEEKVKSIESFVNKADRKEIVKRNEQWEYPLDVPTMGKLMSDGYDEEQSEVIISQIDHLKNVTTQMRKGEAIDWIYVSDPDAEAYHYYEGMLPHYRLFTDALIEYEHTIDYMEHKAFGFVMGRDTLKTAQVLLWLEKALKHTHFHRLEFYPIQTEGVRYLDFISNCVRENTRLEDFWLDVTIELSRDIDLLCEVLNNKTPLQEITLTNCGTEEGVFREIFNKLRTENVHKIDLFDNSLCNLRPTDMSEFLSSNPSLEELDLYNNPFNEQDIVYIADALRHNTTLRLLHIDNFNTCNDPALNRRKKIYTLLSKRNRHRVNASFFEQDGIGIKHIPQILSLLKPFSEHHLHDEEGIQGHDDVKPLSIAYEIMRHWKMPELYNLDQLEED